MNSLSKWFQYCTRNFSQRTVELYKGRLQYFDDYMTEQGRLLSTEAIEDYLDNGLESRWTRRIYFAVQQLLSWNLLKAIVSKQ